MCIFCKIIKKEIPASILYEDDQVIAFLDIAQVTKGHTLVLPKKHFNDLFEVDDETLSHMMVILKKLAIDLKERFNANGVNILNNNGVAAGQSVGHLHFHIIPRYDETDAMFWEFRDSGLNVDKTAKELGL